MAINIGLEDNARKTSADALAKVLADTYTLYLKTQNFHWNVAGEQFGQLHAMFGSQYEALGDAIDEIAERIRALGHKAPGSFAEFLKLKTVPEASGAPAARDMIAALAADNEALVRACRAAKDAVEGVGDAESGDLMIERMQVHGKNAWMLRVQLEK